MGPLNCKSQLLFVVVIFDVFDERMLTKVILITPMVVLSDPPTASETPPKSVGRDPLKISDNF